jgi:hypothetical protein
VAHDSCQLRRAKLLAGEDPHNPGQLDTHPRVREHFGEQLHSQRTEVRKECNRRLYDYYRTLAPQLPNSFREMEPLFLAVICGCNAGQFREALHEVHIPWIQRGDAAFAANVLGARGALLSVWSISLRVDVGVHPRKRMSRSRASLRKISSSFSYRRRFIYRLHEECNHRRCEFVTSAQSPCVIRLIVPCSFMWH